MANFTITGNTTVASEIVYIQGILNTDQLAQGVSGAPVGSGFLSQQAVTDGSGNYSFTVPNGTYQIKTAGKPGVRQVVVVNGFNVSGINFSA